MPQLHRVAAAALPGVGLETFYDAYLWSYQEAERFRAESHEEVPAPGGSSSSTVGWAPIPPRSLPAVTERLLATHMACLAGAAEPMPGQGELLDWLRGRYRLAVVSNFDYTPTVRRILTESGILGRFETVVVSDTVGWRKPRPDIFQRALTEMGVAAGECLFVGDRPDIDVAGAKGMGMAAAWLNPDRAPLPSGLPVPDLDLAGSFRPPARPGEPSKRFLTPRPAFR